MVCLLIDIVTVKVESRLNKHARAYARYDTMAHDIIFYSSMSICVKIHKSTKVDLCDQYCRKIYQVNSKLLKNVNNIQNIKYNVNILQPVEI